MNPYKILTPKMARNRLAVLSRASTKGTTPEKVAEARTVLTMSKLAQAIDEALEADPPLSEVQKKILADRILGAPEGKVFL